MSKSVRLVLVQLLSPRDWAPRAGGRAGTREAAVVRVVDDTVDVQFRDDGSTGRISSDRYRHAEVVDPRKPVQCFGREASEHAHGY